MTMRIQRALATNDACHADRLNLRVLVDLGTVNSGRRAFSSQLVINQLRLIESNPVPRDHQRRAAALAMFTSPRVHELTIRAPVTRYPKTWPSANRPPSSTGATRPSRPGRCW
ncbi:hypothetical protein [Amycolatopsis plumensis]|uniref:Uncharacterized protein n=1 Tax=Amycolatopsis plumensis TaxID=236508 RepID=A0ABV5U491_9PSEU